MWKARQLTRKCSKGGETKLTKKGMSVSLYSQTSAHRDRLHICERDGCAKIIFGRENAEKYRKSKNPLKLDVACLPPCSQKASRRTVNAVEAKRGSVARRTTAPLQSNPRPVEENVVRSARVASVVAWSVSV
ncbi:unnamed protein product [Acanthoscelides obtectus]|uniref:Uncharacterized protein n=1 Tax=Acanthoscelides obtectus TaxID=200917 RepID=A0A9P0Q4V3_ACAOB|nr:unnamed protein product [Acanthoscelides obtectus]CAK1638680.1 hypothetical protein AOBTE_LOCUS10754 [Acanthoscelides obtectus]